MSKVNYIQKREKENYFRQAKKLNVRARSYFKLEQINNKFNLLEENTNILDLGSAPGGWLEFIDKTLKQANIIGIDLLEIKKQYEFSKNVKIIEDDFENINQYYNLEFDLILSDMAQEFSGNSKVDRGRTHKLNFKVLDFCQKHLKKTKNCVFKSFEGEDLEKVKNYAKKQFTQIKEFKPKSSQKKSSETFIICLNKI